MNLVMTLRKSEGPTFYKIVEAVFNMFDNYTKQIRSQELMKVVRKADQLGIRKRAIWNKLSAEIFANWEDCSFFDKVCFLEILIQNSVDVSKEIKALMESSKEGSFQSVSEIRGRFLKMISEANIPLSDEEFADIESIAK